MTDTQQGPGLTAVAQTAMLVAAARLAEARHKEPVLTDDLLEAMIGDSRRSREPCDNASRKHSSKRKVGIQAIPMAIRK